MHQGDAVELLLAGEAAVGLLAHNAAGGIIGPGDEAAFAPAVVGELLDGGTGLALDQQDRAQVILEEIPCDDAAGDDAVVGVRRRLDPRLS